VLTTLLLVPDVSVVAFASTIAISSVAINKIMHWEDYSEIIIGYFLVAC
jgi:hypothetical protein